MKTHEVFNFDLEVITPTHIGMGKEKEYIEGLDFIYNYGNKEYIVLKPDEILRQVDAKDLVMVSEKLASGNAGELSGYFTNKGLINNDSILYAWPSWYAPGPNAVKATYRDAMGKWLIPGSSIKGTIRSIILKSLHSGENQYNPENLLGKINNDPLRFLQVTDCSVEGLPAIYPVKIFSADLEGSEKIGKWKHERRGGHDEQFAAKGFVSYEMLTDGVNNTGVAKGKFRIGWGTTEGIARRVGQEMPGFGRLFNGQNSDYLINMIKTYTNQYLEQEIDFFDAYPNNVLSEESFLEELHWLKEENLKDSRSCLIRVGANVGYHSITGNWEFPDHVDAVQRNRGRIVKGMEKAYKTRKLVFDFNDEGKRRFALPGFVKITLA
ncbi:MAG TPA: RAMP superfamily CRISPR-associated protein [Niabella sp.]|nr:RAMP superfamily CRISPR-associated protein [Niabella sp.]